MKICNHCNLVRAPEHFAIDVRNVDGLDGRCQSCRDLENVRSNYVSTILRGLTGGIDPYKLPKEQRLRLRRVAHETAFRKFYGMERLARAITEFS